MKQSSLIEGYWAHWVHFQRFRPLGLLDRIPLVCQGADAIYCFVSGHCNNTQVTDKTSMHEAEGICDKIYGQTPDAQCGFRV